MAGKLACRVVEATGVTYHEDMIGHVCLWDSNHPECPDRFAKILKRCEALKLLDRCRYIPPRLAEPEEILRKHDPELLALLKDSQVKSAEESEEISSHYDSIFICPETYRLALAAAGSTIDLVKAVCNDEVKNGMAIVRPPGHHAMASEYCGYCFFNNVALAADCALRTYNFSRILIVDWDVHHGQATQQMFYNDPRVLYFSIHRFEHGTFWPNLRESNSDFIGEGPGEGFNFNVPLNDIGLGNADYLTIFHQILLPVAVEYQPELIIVSAGFDAAVGCPEGEMKVTPACFAHFVNSLSHLANGRIAVVLEGGYFVKSLAEGAALSLRALLNDPCPQIEPLEEIDVSTRETILNCIYTHKRFWKCFQMHCLYPSQGSSSSTDCFHPVIKFEYDGVPLEKFPTRDCYPVRNEEIVQFYTWWINKLIDGTDLYETKYQCSCFSSASSKNYEQIKSFQHPRSRTVLVPENLDSEQTVYSILDCIFKHETNSAIIDASFSKLKSDKFAFETNLISQAVSKFECKKIVMIDLSSKNKDISELTNVDSGCVLRFSFDQSKPETGEHKNDFDIRFPWSMESLTDSDFMTAWFKLILPISYQFDTHLVIISMNFGEGSKLSVELHAFLLRWLTSLANGKVILIADYDSGKERESLSFSYCLRAFLGSPLPVLPKTNCGLSSTAANVLKTLARELGNRWKNVNFFVSFPED